MERTYSRSNRWPTAAPGPVVHPKDDRYLWLIGIGLGARPEHPLQCDAYLDVDHVIGRQHRDRASLLDARGLQRLAQRGVAEDHRHVESVGGGQVAVVVVAIDHRHVVTGGVQIADHPDAE